MDITLYVSATNVIPINATLTFPELTEFLRSFTSTPWKTDKESKKRYRGFTPGRVITRRCSENAISLDGIAADFDIGPNDPRYLTFEQACQALVARGVQFIAYTTTGSQPEHHKYRIVMPFAASVPAASYEAAWELVNRKFNGSIDASTKDPSRLSFLPAAWIGAYNDFFVNPVGAPILSTQELSGLPSRGTVRKAVTTKPTSGRPSNALAPNSLAILAQGKDAHWSGWRLLRDYERSPLTSPCDAQMDEGNRTYRLMCRIAARAKAQGLPIDVETVAELAETYQRQVRFVQPPQRHELARRATDALIFVFEKNPR